LFEALKNEYKIENALYPGSFTHITASFFIPKVIYVDVDKQAKRFFKDMKAVKELINSEKTYPQETSVDFIGQSYTEPLAIKKESVDLLISQFSGIISRYCKNYLKLGGLLLANNSHADAGIAYLDKDYELIAVVNEVKGRTIITNKGLKDYFIPKGNINPSIESLMKSGKGIKYTQTSENYIFKRIN
jgi:hypothetical protein